MRNPRRGRWRRRSSLDQQFESLSCCGEEELASGRAPHPAAAHILSSAPTVLARTRLATATWQPCADRRNCGWVHSTQQAKPQSQLRGGDAAEGQQAQISVTGRVLRGEQKHRRLRQCASPCYALQHCKAAVAAATGALALAASKPHRFTTRTIYVLVSVPLPWGWAAGEVALHYNPGAGRER